MTQETKVIIGIAVATLLILIDGIFFSSNGQQPNANPSLADTAILTRNANHKITARNAKVVIVEFADFQCPACRQAHPVLKQILDEYKGKVTFIYRHFPLPQHQNAVLAAEAAGEQGKFWEMHNILYERQNEWSESNNVSEIFTTYAKELKIDTSSFTTALKNNKYDDTILKDKSGGIALGVNSTPTLFLNSKKITVGVDYQSLKITIEVELRK